MSSNGKRNPPRPRIELVTGSPSGDEAAAIVTALELYLVETAPAPAPDAVSRWQQTALWEGVNRAPGRGPLRRNP